MEFCHWILSSAHVQVEVRSFPLWLTLEISASVTSTDIKRGSTSCLRVFCIGLIFPTLIPT